MKKDTRYAGSYQVRQGTLSSTTEVGLPEGVLQDRGTLLKDEKPHEKLRWY